MKDRSLEIAEMLEPVMPVQSGRAWVESVFAVGSRITCDPAPTDTDEDFLVVVRKRNPGAMAAAGFELDTGGSHYEPSEGQFNSWRKGSLNLIVTDDRKFARRFLAASAVAQRLNLLNKADRIALFQAVLYGATDAPLEGAGLRPAAIAGGY